MSRDLKLKFEEYQENDPTNRSDDGNSSDHYPTGGNVRNLAFVLADGKMQFFNYSYLITASYDPDNGSIFMEFTTHHVTLKGEKLEALFYELMMQSKRIIQCINERYKTLSSKDDTSIILKIDIQCIEHT